MHVQMVQEWEERVTDTACTCASLRVPPLATASFATALMSLRWAVRFEVLAEDAATGETETLQWQVPLLVVP